MIQTVVQFSKSAMTVDSTENTTKVPLIHSTNFDKFQISTFAMKIVLRF